MKVKPPIKTKPEYEGVNAWRSSSNKQKIKCASCIRFATHVGMFKRDDSRVFMCPTHARIHSTNNAVHRVEAMAEYKKHLANMQQWTEQQQTVEQGTLI